MLAVGFAATLRAQNPPRVIVTAPPLPSVEEIVRRALANDDLRREHRLGLVCDQMITVARLDDRGEVFKSKILHLRHREGTEISYSHGLELPPDAQDAHHHRDGDIAKANHRMALMNWRELVPRFRCTLVGEAPLRGRNCYLVAYSPRGETSANDREQRVIDALRGRFWVDEKSFAILQGEGSLEAPVPVALLASVTRLDFSFDTRPMPDGEAGPGEFRVDLTVKAPFYFYRQQQTTRLENWRPAVH